MGGFYGFALLIGLLNEYMVLPEIVNAFFGLLVLPLFVVAIIAQIKRWHDRNKSGLWVFIHLIPVLGSFWCFIECGCLRGTRGTNRFGEDPLQWDHFS